MSEHPDLSALLRAELTNDEVLEAGDHLDGCEPCRSDLAELATAHALLARSGRTLGAVASPEALAPLRPPARPPFLPPTRRRGPVLLAAAAAVVVAAGVGTTYAVLGGDDAPDDRPTASADLQPVEGSARGRVEMAGSGTAGTRMTITTEDLPPAGSGRFYEAWLLDPATQKMLPLGQLGPRGTASFEIDDALLAGYSAVDVSLEDDDGDPQHSVTSVLRATYGPDA